MINSRKSTAQERALKNMPDDIIMIEAATRMGTSLTTLIKPVSPSPLTVDLDLWKTAGLYARNTLTPNRNPLYQVYDNIQIDLNLESLLNKRIEKLKQAKFVIKNEKGDVDQVLTELFKTTWFQEFLEYVMQAKYEGFRLVEFFEFNEDGTIKSIDVVDKYHVKPERNLVVVNPSDEKGTDYTSGVYPYYYLPIGKKKQLGLLYKIAPSVLAKKYAVGAWCEYDEKIGIPFRTVTSPGNDAKRQKQLAIIMENMGSAGWAVLNENEKVELLQIGAGDPTKCFENLCNYLDGQVASAIVGQNQTSNSSNNKGTYGSMVILAEITADIHEADLTYAKAIITEELFPRLLNFGYKLQGKKFDWDKSLELGVADLIDYVVKLDGAGYETDAEYITQKTGIPVTRKAVEAPTKPTPPKGEKKS